MLIERTNMLVTNVNPRKEGSGDGMTLASDVKVSFQAQRLLLDKLVPDQERKYSDQYFTDKGDVRLHQMFPIPIHMELKEMRAGIYFGNKPLDFKPVTIKGFSITPVSGGYLDVTCTLQLHPTVSESGKLDSLVKEVVPIEIEALTGDMINAGTETTDSE